MRIDLDNLDFALHAEYAELAMMGEARMEHNQWMRHIFIDRGADVLAVAHIDSVQEGLQKDYWLSKDFLISPVIDNRLGLYIALFMLPEMGIEVDVLLTDNEESCRSTAAHFHTEKQYNWMVSFDRKGEDVVVYQYDDDAWMAKLESIGFTVGWGSYSDISDLEFLGCCGVNVGCGMQDYHSADAYANLNVLRRQLQKFEKFYHTHHADHVAFVPQPIVKDYHYTPSYIWRDDMPIYDGLAQEWDVAVTSIAHGATGSTERIHLNGDGDYCYGEPTDDCTFDICDMCGVHEREDRLLQLEGDDRFVCAWCARHIFGGVQ